MTSITLFFLGALGTLLFTFVVVLYLRAHLARILEDLCGTHDRARFWLAFSNVVLILTPLIFCLFAFPEEAAPTLNISSLVAQLRFSLMGLVFSVLILGFVISRFIPRQAADPHPQTPSSQPRG